MSTIWDHDPETGEIIEQPKGNTGEYSVSEIANALKRTLEDRFGHVRVRGEISGFKGPSASGHCYFSIKDEGAKLDAVVWRGSFGRLRAKMQEGLEVIATGKLTITIRPKTKATGKAAIAKAAPRLAKEAFNVEFRT